MLGLGTIGQFTIGQVVTQTAEIISADKWFVSLSEPKRFRAGLRTGSQQTIAFQHPFVSFSWMEGLSEPKRFKPRLIEGRQQFLVSALIPTILVDWFSWFSEPVRLKR